MAEFFYFYGLFLFKAVTVVAAVVAVLIAIAALASKSRKRGPGGKLAIRKVNEQLDDMRDALTLSLLEPAARKVELKRRKAADKAEQKAEKAAAKKAKRQRGKGETIVVDPPSRRIFLLDFDGDIRASNVDNLRREISAVITTATPEDEVVIRLESGGGMVTGYGLGASQLDRLREHKIPLTVCVDKVAASGGYMMACVADKLVAAPFAVVGSIGVVAQIPNFHRLLKELNIDFELLTAGKFKRTLTVFGENTDEARAKFLEDIERIHDQFKQYVGSRRSGLDIDSVATGEIWSGQDALERNLIDELSTSDEYLTTACQEGDVLHVTYKERKSLMEKVGVGVELTVDRLAVRWLSRLMQNPVQ